MTWGFTEVRLENFRCFPELGIEPAPRVNVIAGANASGKTSLLEALFFLGRGTSFRASRAEAAIRTGSPAATVFGRLNTGAGSPQRVGVEVSRAEGLSIRIDGVAGNRASLAATAPVQLLDPASHELIQGPPAIRRQFLDWGVFHVEHGFLEQWQRYRRALQQRNAALRSGAGEAAWAWDGALVEAGEVLTGCRDRAIASMLPRVQALAQELIGQELGVDFLRGWTEGEDLGQALSRARERDQLMGSSQVGPHRADLRIELRSRRAKDAVSRGQEKLVAAALTLSQIEQVAAALDHPVVLLVDEPGADLDRTHLGKLQNALWASPAQVFVTALDPDLLQPPEGGQVFHVEHGKAQALL